MHRRRKIARKRRCHCAWRTGGGGIENLPRAPQSRVSISCGYCSIVSKAYPKAVCITTGGQGKDEPQSEGEAAKEALIKFGVAPKRIFAEVNSKTTLENLRFARDILRENGFSDTVLLATQSYHQWRAAAWQKCWDLRRIRCMRRPI